MVKSQYTIMIQTPFIVYSFTSYLPAVMGGQLSAPASDIGYDILAARPLLSAEFIDMYAASEGWGA